MVAMVVIGVAMVFAAGIAIGWIVDAAVKATEAKHLRGCEHS